MKKPLTFVTIASILVLLLSGCVGLPDVLTPPGVQGSGNIVEQRYDKTGFTAVSIENAFSGEVTYADEFSVVVRTDDNVLEEVLVRMEGGTLHVGLARSIRFNTNQMHVAITMPAIEAISLSGATRVALNGFDHAPAFTATVSGASTLTGAVSADTLDLSVSGAGTATLTGEAQDLTLDLLGASQANLVELVVETADVTLSGASKAEVTASQAIALEASGASSLTYGGGAALTSSQLSGASTVRER